MGRLKSGRGRSLSALLDRIPDAPGTGPDTMSLPPDTLDVWQLSSMREAADSLPRMLKYMPFGGSDAARKKQSVLAVGELSMGNEQRSADSVAQSDALMEAAIASDPRLAKRARWHRGEEGEIACPALVAAGDDAPCFFRRRNEVSEAGGGDPVRIVVSTDSNEVPPGTAAAFIATVRLVQQWRSVEVWWQGAWLSPDRQRGWVFHVPLVLNGMDYTRLDFCLSSGLRDTVSYSLMMTRACEVTRRRWNGHSTTADRCYLHAPGIRTVFVPHNGITPTGTVVSAWAAMLLGWDFDMPTDEMAALQLIPSEPTPFVETTEQKAARERQQKQEAEDRRKAELAAAAARLQAVSRNF